MAWLVLILGDSERSMNSFTSWGGGDTERRTLAIREQKPRPGLWIEDTLLCLEMKGGLCPEDKCEGKQRDIHARSQEQAEQRWQALEPGIQIAFPSV